MIRKCFIEDLQGHRWCFKPLVYTDGVEVIDTLGEFSAFEITKDVADVLAEQLSLLQQYQNDDRNQLLLPNLILDFVKENKDIDKDIIVAIIENITYGMD